MCWLQAAKDWLVWRRSQLQWECLCSFQDLLHVPQRVTLSTAERSPFTVPSFFDKSRLDGRSIDPSTVAGKNHWELQLCIQRQGPCVRGGALPKQWEVCCGWVPWWPRISTVALAICCELASFAGLLPMQGHFWRWCVDICRCQWQPWMANYRAFDCIFHRCRVAAHSLFLGSHFTFWFPG